MHHTRLLCAIGVRLWSAAFAGSQAAPQVALPGQLRAHVQDERFGIVTSMRELPLGRCLALLVSLMLWCIAPGAQAAERELHWDALDVEAHLRANGVLDVIERHTMVFTGDWIG